MSLRFQISPQTEVQVCTLIYGSDEEEGDSMLLDRVLGQGLEPLGSKAVNRWGQIYSIKCSQAGIV